MIVPKNEKGTMSEGSKVGSRPGLMIADTTEYRMKSWIPEARCQGDFSITNFAGYFVL